MDTSAQSRLDQSGNTSVMDAKDAGGDIVTGNPKVAATQKFQVPKNLNLENPGVARANIAATVDAPEGSRDAPRKDLTVLQQHVEFFDRQKRGVIWPWDTYNGFRAVGFNPAFSFMAVFVINPAFSWFSS
ncbi:hypothetical protein HK101_004787, partial [Irineochytrium annulatum]